MKMKQPPGTTGQDERLDVKAACHLIGGSKPINPATLYRRIAKGDFPRPIRFGGSSRWIRTELEAALAKLAKKRVALAKPGRKSRLRERAEDGLNAV